MKKSEIVDNYLEGSDISSINRAELSRKLVKEHPDIFGDDSFENTEKVRAYVRSRIKRMKRQNGVPAIEKLCETHGLPIEDLKHGWIKDKESTLFFKNPLYDDGSVDYLKLRDDIIEEMKAYAPKYKKYKRKKREDGHLLVVDPADIHLGKLASAFETGEDYNAEIAVNRVLEGVEGILEKASGFHIDMVYLIIGNDILHIDTPKRTTTSGTPQDTDGMWYDNFLKAKRLMIEVIEMLLSVADVKVIHNPSNHDFMSSFFLADSLVSWFKNCEQVEFDCSMSHRKYSRYHNNIIGTTHGDGAKSQDLPLLMAHECDDWSAVTNRYIYIHHIHHKMAKDYVGVTVESLRSPSGTDSWHHRNGYQHAPKAVEGFIHHKEHGQIARLTHIF